MPESPISSFQQISDNNLKVDEAIDHIVISALNSDDASRADHEELKKTSKLLIISDMTLGGRELGSKGDVDLGPQVN